MKKKQKKSNRVFANKLASVSDWFFRKSRISIAFWISLLLFGLLSYGFWLNREGFPSIQVPFGISNATYLADAQTIDKQISKPVTKALSRLDKVKDIQATSGENYFSVVASFEDSVSPEETVEKMQQTIESLPLPEEASFNHIAIDPSKYLFEYDMLVSVYSLNGQTVAELQKEAESVAKRLEGYDSINSTEVVKALEESRNPISGKTEILQTSFSKYGRLKDESELSQAVLVGLKSDASAIELSDATQKAIEDFDSEDVGIAIAADFAPSIKNQINSLQDNVISGLIAVSIISFLLITWRASAISALFIATVILSTLFILLLIGYSLNTITLFALVLALGLFVDDATIIVEAIDANKKKGVSRRQIVKSAISRVASASFAGTMTTVLVFLPLVFVSGILGEFIRILPITIIVALITSLVLSLTIIPTLSKYILLNKLTPSWVNPISKAEKWMADKLSSFIKLLKTNKKVGVSIATLMIGLSIAMFMGSGYFANKLEFNIFPPTKDSDSIQLVMDFPNGTTIEEAKSISNKIDRILDRQIGEYIESAVYVESNQLGATLITELTSFRQRDITSVEMVDKLDKAFSKFDQAGVRVFQVDGGPPVEQFPFKVQIETEKLNKANALAKDISKHLNGLEITRPNGTTANIVATNINDAVTRNNQGRFIQVEAAFDADDITALVEAAKKEVEEEFDLKEYGLKQSALKFDFGQESENQESFSSLAIVGPIAVLAMFILLAIQFKSLLQPLLIFLAIPFSMFGVMFGLYITDNPIGFFTMIGFFGLIGIAVNNTILLTDYINQARAQNLSLIDAVAKATQQRFRPLLATSLTTIAALLPLALTDPFWEGLAYTIIFGLMSNTILVILAFPYYYLLAEGIKKGILKRFRR